MSFHRLIVFLLGLAACSAPLATSDPIFVDFNNTQPISEVESFEVDPFRIAVAAVISPEGTVESYEPLLGYLEEELGRPIELLQRRTYAEINDLIKTGEVDLAFVCTSAYIVGREDFDMKLLVAPIADGETHYHSQLIVRKENAATSMVDLRGSVFAFTDPMSFSGRMYPTYLLKLMGETPSSFFQRVFFTYSHDDAIRAVANGLADGASVDSLVLDYVLMRDPDLQNEIKVIDTSPPFGIPPVVVGPEIHPQLQAQLAEILLNMHANERGQRALRSLEIDGFTFVTEEIYDTVAQIYDSVEGQLNSP